MYYIKTPLFPLLTATIYSEYIRELTIIYNKKSNETILTFGKLNVMNVSIECYREII